MKKELSRRDIIAAAKYICCFIILLSSTYTFGQKFDQLAKTPPMGWNSWNKFGCDVNEKMIREIADAMVSSGMKDAGYEYINIDDCWHGKRDSLGFIHPDPERFPSGMKALSDYVHSLGLKLGIYSDAGAHTCGGKPASRGHEYQDAITYAQWGIDYLKYDWCDTDSLNPVGSYTTMRDAIYSAGRPMVFSMCEWGTSKPWLWAKNVGHSWRTTGDIYACFDCKVDHGTWFQLGAMYILDLQQGLRDYAGPGHWNDPDMLEVGNGMSVNEDRAHFTMWCMLDAPLISGNDLRNMPKETKDILINQNVIGLNQDSLGVEAFKYSAKDSVEIWFKPLVHGDWAICFLNRSIKPQSVSFDWKKEVVKDNLSKRDAAFDKTVYSLHNLWSNENAGTTDKILKTEVQGHDVLVFKLTKK